MTDGAAVKESGGAVGGPAVTHRPEDILPSRLQAQIAARRADEEDVPLPVLGDDAATGKASIVGACREAHVSAGLEQHRQGLHGRLENREQ